jgi:2-polyprenyl-3-methyl-5-hydroxy-6-metoxy-1,4-benzoquinol methylase
MLRGWGRVRARYRKLGLGARSYGFIRWILCPFDRILPHVPEQGRLLDIGCGSGLWLTYLSLERPGLRLEGLDPDPRKLEIARNASIAGLVLHRGFAVDVPEGGFDCITIIDVLCLLPDDEKRNVLQACRAALRPGGVLIAKEIDVRPRWKFWPAVAEEFIAVVLVGLTQGDRLHFQSLEDLAADFAGAGLDDVSSQRVDRGYAHPHVLVQGQRRG